MKKKKKQEDPSPIDLLPVMTVSLFLILLTFFILLNSIAVIDEKRVRVALGSILGAFGSYTGGYSSSRTGEVLIQPGAPMELQEIDFVKVLNLEQRDIADHVQLIYKDENQAIVLESRFLFEPGSLTLRPESETFLDNLISLIHPADFPVEIIGHVGEILADDTGYESAWERSFQMAETVFLYLKTRHDALDERLHVYGAGVNRPRFSTQTARSRALNDRVEITLYPEKSVDTHRILKKTPSNIFTFDTFDFRIFD
jgi:chemotaxis protein MotB